MANLAASLMITKSCLSGYAQWAGAYMMSLDHNSNLGNRLALLAVADALWHETEILWQSMQALQWELETLPADDGALRQRCNEDLAAAQAVHEELTRMLVHLAH